LERRLASAARHFEGNSRAAPAFPLPEIAMDRKKPKPDDKPTDDDKLDRALEDTFPASDPVSFIEPAPRKKKKNETPRDRQP
jgi:hypothetical protein